MAQENEKKVKEKKVRAKDVQRGVWNPETLSEIKYKAETGKHRIRGCGATIRFPNFDDLLILGIFIMINKSIARVLKAVDIWFKHHLMI